MILTVPYPPSSNVYWRMYRGRMVTSDEARFYRQKVKWLAVKELPRPLKPLEGPVCLSLTVYRPQKRGDLSNRIKVLEDALQGVLYVNDSQVVELHGRLLDDKANPRVVVTVEPTQ